MVTVSYFSGWLAGSQGAKEDAANSPRGIVFQLDLSFAEDISCLFSFQKVCTFN